MFMSQLMVLVALTSSYTDHPQGHKTVAANEARSAAGNPLSAHSRERTLKCVSVDAR